MAWLKAVERSSFMCFGGKEMGKQSINIYGAYTVHHQPCWGHILAHASRWLKPVSQSRPFRISLITHASQMKKLRLGTIKELCSHYQFSGKNEIWIWIFVSKVHAFSVSPDCYLRFRLEQYGISGKLKPLLFLSTEHFLPWISEGPSETFLILSLLLILLWGDGLVT